MKKIGRLVLILALVLTLLPCAAWGESKEEYGTAIQNALDSLANSFSGGNRAAAQKALLAVRETVFNAVLYLAKNGQYDARCVSILECANEAYGNWSNGSSYSENMKQAYAANQTVFLKGANNTHYVSLSVGSAVLSGPGYTGIEFDIYHNCDRWGGSVYAGSVKRNNCEIPVKVYSENVPGQGGNGDEFDLDYARDVVIYAYIDEADYNAASPGTYTGSLSYGLWGMDGGDGHVYSVTGGGEIQLTLVKPGEVIEYEITAEASPVEGGTVSGTGVFYPNEPVVLTAEAAEGYRFVNWTENGSVVSADANCILTVTADRHLVANFEEYAPALTSVTVTPPTRTQFEVGEAFDPAGMVVTAHYEDESAKDVTSSAVISGFDSSAVGRVLVVVSYTEGGETASAMFPVEIIEPVVRDITIQVTAEPDSNAGTVSGAGTYPMNTFVTVTATPNEHYTFAGWTWNGETVSTDASYTFSLTANYDNTSLVAVFEEVPVYTITTYNCFVTLSGDDPTNPLTYAEPGTRLFIWWDYENPPEGMYCTGDFSVDGYILPPLEYEFTMPEGDVTAAVVYMPQETLTVDLSAGPVLVPGFALYPCGDMEWNDPDEFSYYLMDLNGDGTFDLKVVPEEDGNMLVSPLSGMLALSPSVTKDISEEHEIYGTVVFRFTPPAFDDGTADTTLVLPAELEAIEANAFEGDTAFTAVDAGHCMVLGAKAFKGCAGLTKIRLAGKCTIDEHAFDGCTSLYAIYGPEGSETQAWAETHHLLFIGE